MVRRQQRSVIWSQLGSGLHRDREAAQQGIRGLYLQVGEASAAGTRARSWVLRYMKAGTARTLGLGSFPAVTVEMARQRAQEARTQLAEGQNPLQAKRQRTATLKAEAKAAEALAVTFKQVAEALIETREGAWKNKKHRQQWRSTLQTYAYPVIGSKAPADITTEDVLAILKPIWTTKAETATRIRQRIETVLNAARVQGLRSGENPATLRGHLDHYLPKVPKAKRVEHHAALAYDRLPAFWSDLTQREGLASKALQLLILTVTRTGEILGAQWSEFDLKKTVWTIPAERMKGGKEHRIPLSKPVLELLASIPRAEGNDVMFSLSNMALLALLKRMKVDVTAHGFRSSFSDWCAEQTTYPAEVREMALAHAVGNAVEAAYRRGDLYQKRVALMHDWAVFVASRGNAQLR